MDNHLSGFEVLFDNLWDLLSCEERKVGYIKPKDNNGIGVSTVWANDILSFETALLTDMIIPVERYSNLEQAKVGHEKWIEYVRTTTDKTIIKLGLKGFVDNEPVNLIRVKQ